MRSIPLLLLLTAFPLVLGAAEAPGPLQVSRTNGRYFVDPAGAAVYLAGTHDGWELQDCSWGDTNEGIVFDWPGFLDFLVENNNNVIRLWCVESTRINDDDPDLTEPMPYLRAPGSGKARDGGDRFDLERFNPAYFDRLQTRVREAGDRGIYVIVMLFQGWSVEDKRGRVNPWPYHPLHADNNTNGLDGDIDADGQGRETHTWLGKDHPVTRHQRAYVRKVVDTIGRFDNVLYEISNESHHDSIEWQSRMVEYIHHYEKGRDKQHAVGISVTFDKPWRVGMNQKLLRSPGDWIAPNREGPKGFSYRDNPPPADGAKVILSDTDHFFGNKGKDHSWAWKSFCRGLNLLYMDMWTVEQDDPDRRRVRRTLGDIRRYADRMDLLSTAPRGDLSSTNFCLASPGREYLVYAPMAGEITVDLSAATSDDRFAVEWFHPRESIVLQGEEVGGGRTQAFARPRGGDIVLYLKRVKAPQAPQGASVTTEQTLRGQGASSRGLNATDVCTE